MVTPCAQVDKGEVAVQSKIDLPTSSLSKWHYRRELQLRSCLIVDDTGAHA